MTTIVPLSILFGFSLKFENVKDDGDDEPMVVALHTHIQYIYDSEEKSKLMMKMTMTMTMVVSMMMMLMMMMTRMVVAMYINSVVALQGLLLSLFHSFSTVAHFSQL